MIFLFYFLECYENSEVVKLKVIVAGLLVKKERKSQRKELRSDEL